MKARRREALASIPGMGIRNTPAEPRVDRVKAPDVEPRAVAVPSPAPPVAPPAATPPTGHAGGETERIPVKMFALDCQRCGVQATLIAPADSEMDALYCPHCGVRSSWQIIEGEHESFRVISKAPVFSDTMDSPPQVTAPPPAPEPSADPVGFTDAQVHFHDLPSLPSTDALLDLKPGDHVKVRPDTVGTEKFWVKLAQVGASLMMGVITNNLGCTASHGLSKGDGVYLERRHCFNIIVSEPAEADAESPTD